MREDSTPKCPDHNPRGWTPRERYTLLIAAIATFIVAIISLAGSWQTSSSLTRHVQCQAEWNSFLHRALEARTGAGAEATAAMDDLINAITEAKSTTETREALNRYKAARANQVQKQQDNPLPPPPNEVCEI